MKHKLLEESIYREFLNMGLISEFLDLTPKAKATEAKINKWGNIKLKNLYKAKKITKEI